MQAAILFNHKRHSADSKPRTVIVIQDDGKIYHLRFNIAEYGFLSLPLRNINRLVAFRHEHTEVDRTPSWHTLCGRSHRGRIQRELPEGSKRDGEGCQGHCCNELHRLHLKRWRLLPRNSLPRSHCPLWNHNASGMPVASLRELHHQICREATARRIAPSQDLCSSSGLPSCATHHRCSGLDILLKRSQDR